MMTLYCDGGEEGRGREEGELKKREKKASEKIYSCTLVIKLHVLDFMYSILG
jgi:hypothetical protein